MSWFARATAGSAAGELARATDWASTPVGDPETWDPAVRAAVTLCFGTRFPALLAWGPDLTMLYNDGYTPMLGERHPAAMGRPLAQVWADVWPEIDPMIDRVLRGREPVWLEHQPFLTTRSGFPEATSFTFCYSPLVDSAGAVVGILDLSVETTELVTANRRLATLGTLSSSLHEVSLDLPATFARAAEVLRAASNVPRADVYLLDAGEPVLRMTTAEAGAPALDPGLLTRVALAGAGERLGDVLLEPLPTGARGRSLPGVVAVWRNPKRPDDEGQRSFVHLVARTLSQAIGRAIDHTRQVEELREVSVALQLAILSPEQSDARWHTRYLPADSGLAVGGDWYDVVDLPYGWHGLVVGDCVGHGLHAAAIMGQLRSAARALLLQGLTPGRVVEGLDRFAALLPGAEAATVLCAVVSPDGELTYAAAGHPWPLVVGPDRTEWLKAGRGAPLTYADGPRDSATARLAPGERLVLYTDGLVERRGETLSAGLERLAGVARAALGAPSTVMLADRLLATLLPHGGQRDDVAIVVYGDSHAVTAPPTVPVEPVLA